MSSLPIVDYYETGDPNNLCYDTHDVYMSINKDLSLSYINTLLSQNHYEGKIEDDPQDNEYIAYVNFDWTFFIPYSKVQSGFIKEGTIIRAYNSGCEPLVNMFVPLGNKI